MTSAPRSASSFVQYWPISPARSRTRISSRADGGSPTCSVTHAPHQQPPSGEAANEDGAQRETRRNIPDRIYPVIIVFYRDGANGAVQDRLELGDRKSTRLNSSQ